MSNREPVKPGSFMDSLRHELTAPAPEILPGALEIAAAYEYTGVDVARLARRISQLVRDERAEAEAAGAAKVLRAFEEIGRMKRDEREELGRRIKRGEL